jgi:tRNA (guanine-N7-)-methyltransferase
MALRENLVVEPIMLRVEDEAGKLSYAEVFGNDHAVELEIGAGKGTFLLNIGAAQPGTNFIGIEWAKAYAEFAADRLRRHGLTNCRIVNAEASWWIRCHIPDSSLAAIHIYFPDPWPKARHHKRRLIQLPFLKEVHRALEPGGKLRLVTDHADYFAHMKQTLAGQDDLKVISFDSPVAAQGSGGEDLIVGTNFEKKYVAEGRTFNAIAATKPGELVKKLIG